MKLNELELFLVKCAGGDIETLDKDKVPVEYNKLVGIGGAVFLTAIYAGFAMAFAVSWVFDDKPSIFLICLFWGFAIFNLDRFIVSTTYKRETFQFSDFLQLIFRGCLTVMIALTISIPLEIKFFEKELNQWIEDRKKTGVYDNPELTRLENEREARWNEYKDEVDNGTGGKRPKTVGPVSEKYYQDYKTAEKQYDAKLKQLEEEAASEPVGFLSLFKALEEYKQEDEYVAKISKVITFLLIVFELTPILIKFILPMGNYDERIGYRVLKGRLRMRSALERFFNQKPIKGIRIPQQTIYQNHEANAPTAPPRTSRTATAADEKVFQKAKAWMDKAAETFQSKLVDIGISAVFAVVLAVIMAGFCQQPFPEMGALASFLLQNYLVINNQV